MLDSGYCSIEFQQRVVVEEWPRSQALPLSSPNIVHEKLKERESLVWNCAHPWPLSIEFLPNHGLKGRGEGEPGNEANSLKGLIILTTTLTGHGWEPLYLVDVINFYTKE